MSSPLAPSRSPRPVRRETPEERRARERAAADAIMEEFAALEDRADMDPFLRNNPLRRLGYRAGGGLRSTDFLPLAPNEAIYFRAGYGIPQLDQEIYEDAIYGSGLPILRSVELMDPERAAAFEYGAPYLIPRGTVGLGPNYFTPAAQSHEAGHQGFDVLHQILLERPELQTRFTDAGLQPFLGGGAAEEAVVELGDDLTATWVQPRGEGRPVGTHESVFHTVQYLPDRGTREYAVSDEEFERLQRYEQIAQAIALDELFRQGEPRGAVQLQPEPGSLFYDVLQRARAEEEPKPELEPEPRGGLLGIFDRLRGN